MFEENDILVFSNQNFNYIKEKVNVSMDGHRDVHTSIGLVTSNF